MNPEAIKSLIYAEDFKPFRIFHKKGKIYDVPHQKQMNYVEETQSCKACDEVADVYRFTVTGRGPFCSDC